MVLMEEVVGVKAYGALQKGGERRGNSSGNVLKAQPDSA
jgi:hypothetical protein